MSQTPSNTEPTRAELAAEKRSQQGTAVDLPDLPRR